MSLKGQEVNIWGEAARNCQPEDLLDIVDQIALIDDLAEAELISEVVANVAHDRGEKGEVAEVLVDTALIYMNRHLEQSGPLIRVL